MRSYACCLSSKISPDLMYASWLRLSCSSSFYGVSPDLRPFTYDLTLDKGFAGSVEVLDERLAVLLLHLCRNKLLYTSRQGTVAAPIGLLAALHVAVLRHVAEIYASEELDERRQERQVVELRVIGHLIRQPDRFPRPEKHSQSP